MLELRRFPDLVVTGEELTELAPGDETNAMVLPEVPGYRVLGILGHGGMGVVYRASQIRLKRDVALKMLPVDAATNAERMRRFVQEAKAASALNHRNIVTIHEIGEAEAGVFIVMEHVAARTQN